MSLSRIALICDEPEGKEILWFLGNLFCQNDWTFRLFESAAQAATDGNRSEYAALFIKESEVNERVFRFFSQLERPPYFFILSEKPSKSENTRQIILRKDYLASDLERNRELISSILLQDEKYTLKIQRTRLIFPFQDIYYLEKQDKTILFHTKAGNYAKRLSMNAVLDEFVKHGFLHVHSSFLVNRRVITAVEKDQLEINHKEWVPVSRGKKAVLETVL